jgi:hypothetical protein
MLPMPPPEGTAVDYEALTLTCAFSSVNRALGGINSTSTIRKSQAMLLVYEREGTINSTEYGHCRGPSKHLTQSTADSHHFLVFDIVFTNLNTIR